ncbi:MAG: P1 family peptidase [Candidatus Obscuribacterales bacterium]|nr:P1 family peptidase [Candidatus Obscuribacterales bacterium]
MNQIGRARLQELGIKIGYLPCGKQNSICDVSQELLLGHESIIKGEGKLSVGEGPVRTGVTVLRPHRGDLWQDRPSAAFFSLNGCGVVTGSDWINECGALEGPIALTNSHSVGCVSKALTKIMHESYPNIGNLDDCYLPVIGECDDSPLNDINGFHVQEEHVRKAFNNASNNESAEGAVGAGTGMSCYGFKGGIGTSSRLIELENKKYTVGALVNTNHGQTHQLMINGIPVGRVLAAEKEAVKNKEGSIVMILATDAAMNQRQLERLCKRACMGLARTGSSAGNGSGDFVIAFSLGRRVPRQAKSAFIELPEIHNDYINPFFEAAAEATEEAILNSIFVADTVIGRDNFKSPGLPVARCLEILKGYAAIQELRV